MEGADHAGRMVRTEALVFVSSSNQLPREGELLPDRAVTNLPAQNGRVN